METMYISGTVQFRGRKHKRQLFADLKREFGDRVRIRIQDNFINYSGRVSRDQMFL